MIRSRTFDWIPGNSVFGSSTGWRPADAPHFDPGNGFLAAHDTIEHLSNKTDWAHELRATGASLFDVKGVAFRHPTAIAEDVLSFAARDHAMTAPKAPAFAYKPLPEEHEAVLQRFAELMRGMVGKATSEARRVGRTITPHEERSALGFADQALPWFRLGYRAAMRVWGAGNGRKVGELMDAVRDAINEDHDKTPPLRGDRLVVSVDTKRLTFEVHRTAADKSLTRSQRMRLAMLEELGIEMEVV